jgi:hypothetical protein
MDEIWYLLAAVILANVALFAVILDYHPVAASILLLVSSGVLLYYVVRYVWAERREASRRRVR